MKELINFSKIQPGIRAKLSFFTASFVTVILILVSFLHLNIQYKALTESLEREIKPLRKYTEKIVLDLENIAFSFLLVEDFRYRLKTKRAELQKYKQQVVKVVEEKSWFTKNILGKLNFIKPGLIDTEDKKVTYSVDTFFSEYITEQKIKEIEESIYSQMRDENGNLISKEKFTQLQKIASKSEENKRKLESLKRELETLQAQREALSTTEPNNSQVDLDNKINNLKVEVETQRKNHEESITELKSEISKFFYQSQRSNIQELGLNTNQIRIQTFHLNSLKTGFDTKIFAEHNFLNSAQLVNHPTIVQDLEEKMNSFDYKKMIFTNSLTSKSISFDNRAYEIFVNPIVSNPNVVHRAKKILDLIQFHSSPWIEFFREDQEICKKIEALSQKLKKRIGELREAKLIKPSQDLEYVQLYKEYSKLLSEREALLQRVNPNKEFRIKDYEELAKQLQTQQEEFKQKENDLIHKEENLKNTQTLEEKEQLQRSILSLKQDLEDLKTSIEQLEKKLQDWSWTPSLVEWDAVANLRNAALFERGILKYRYNPTSYLEFLELQSKRELNQLKWEAVRKWIMEAESETKIKKIIYKNQEIDPFEGGVLSRSRSELEEFMWNLDSTPLYFVDENKNPQGLAIELYATNLVGFTRTIIDKSEQLSKIRQGILKIIFNAGFIGISAIALVFLLSNLMVKHIRTLSTNAELVGKGNLNVRFDIKSRDEIGKLSQTLNEMVIGLIEREKVKNALGKFVNPQIAEMVLKHELKLGGERKMCAVFFSDIRGFTAMSERMEPEKVVEFLNEYLTAMVKCINETHGIVDKFIGDAIMATWGAAYSHGNDAENAINAALKMRASLIEFNKNRGTEDKPLINIGCGLNYGPVLAGQIGSEERLEYTVIGDTVNLASRVEALNKPFGTDILITQNLYEQVKDIFLVEKMQAIQVKGKAEPQIVYAVLGRKDDPNSPKTLEELRKLIGISYKENPDINIEEKEEKFKILENVS